MPMINTRTGKRTTKGPSYPQKKLDGPFEAITYMPHKGCYLRTRHETRKKAQRRLDGNPRHTLHQIIDHSLPVAPGVPEVKEKKTKKKAFLIGA